MARDRIDALCFLLDLRRLAFNTGDADGKITAVADRLEADLELPRAPMREAA